MWYTSIFPEIGKLRQEDDGEFVVSLGYIANARPVRAKINKTANKQQQQNGPERSENGAQ